jgi:DDE superfamily endonuclease
MNWFKEKSIIVMEWPPNSPDMNPIEHLWHCLKTQLHKGFPDTPILRGGPETIKRVLEERLKVVWGDISKDRLETLILSMPHRARVLYEAKGWHTQY